MRFGKLGKRGQMMTNIVLVVVLLVIGTIGFMYTQSALKGDASANAVERIVTQVIDFTVALLGSTIGALIGVDGLEPELVFLKIIVFLLMAIIVVSTFDSIGIFGDAPSAKWTNLLVGIIVSIIGVRFLPENMWEALTAPSSALVFALMMGLPLVALIFVITKIKVEIVRKIIVAAYIIGTGVLFFTIKDLFYRNMALGFMAVALILLLFDSQFIKYAKKEAAKTNLAKGLSGKAAAMLAQLEIDIKDLMAKKTGASTKAIKDAIQKDIDRLQEDYKEINGRYFYS